MARKLTRIEYLTLKLLNIAPDYEYYRDTVSSDYCYYQEGDKLYTWEKVRVEPYLAS